MFVLNLECPRSEVDIMSDPEKTWVEFSDWDAARNACISMLLVSWPTLSKHSVYVGLYVNAVCRVVCVSRTGSTFCDLGGLFVALLSLHFWLCSTSSLLEVVVSLALLQSLCCFFLVFGLTLRPRVPCAWLRMRSWTEVGTFFCAKIAPQQSQEQNQHQR